MTQPEPKPDDAQEQDNKLSQWWKIAYFLPLIVAVVILVTHFCFYRTFLFCSDSPCSPFTAAEIAAGVAPAEQVRFAAYIARASWTLINGVHLLACILAIVTASIVIYRALAAEYDGKTRGWIVLTVIMLAADVALFLALWTAEKDALSPRSNSCGPQSGKRRCCPASIDSIAGATHSVSPARCVWLWLLARRFGGTM